MGFSKDFVWGAATASYQIEGAAYANGKGLSVWDVFCKQPGKVFEGHNGDIACDHYHRYKEDIALMKQIGLKAYRFSISWPRILPAGTGAVNPKGIEFYNNLIDELIDNGIEPYITLYHWDYPYTLHKLGGWLNPESPRSSPKASLIGSPTLSPSMSRNALSVPDTSTAAMPPA